ncbi:uncharacterized protein LOC142098515 [Mixophyes fleayi]|uniref:uncharacterized protein LOC142098515 n=1 Tax=Mixophyes fleayi TaxID=3061075 RepID=UPI003F4E215B
MEGQWTGLEGGSAEQDCQASIEGLAEASLAPSTRRKYRAAWTEWCTFHSQGLGGKEGGDKRMLAFVWAGYQAGKSKASMVAALAGISFFARMKGERDLTKSFLISKALRGWARERPVHSDQRRPISDSLLGNMVAAISTIARDSYEVALFRAAFVMLYFGALRVSELVASSRTFPLSGMLGQHVIISSSSVCCKVRKSKSDQLGRGRWVTLVPRVGCSVCPIVLISQFASLRPSGALPWLVHVDGSPLTRYQFSVVFKRTLTAVGVDCKQFGTHSFRIGAATSAAVAGASEPALKELGRWKSNVYKRYVRPSLLSQIFALLI